MSSDLRDPSTATPFATKAEHDTAVTAAVTAAAGYYDNGTSVIDDATYDALLARIAAGTGTHGWAAGRLLDAVAGGTGSAGGEITHATPMLSLDNAFDDNDLRKFLTDANARLGRQVYWTVEPKMDGIAIAATYRNGKLVQVATRGDGTTGEDITHGCRTVDGLPQTLTEAVDVEVRGELILTNADLEASNVLREQHGDRPFANARNAVAGIVRSKHRTYDLPLSFACYDVLAGGMAAGERYYPARLMIARRLGIATAIDRLSAAAGGQLRRRAGQLLRRAAGLADVGDATQDVQTVIDTVELIGRLRDGLPFGIDGAVIKACEDADRVEIGMGNRAPKWARAYKYPALERVTTLLSITLQVGRTGVITPVAELEPVEVAGTIISRATLSNPLEAVRKDVRPGDRVWVRRAGDVIPEVTGVVDADAADRGPAWELPTACPRCDSPLDTQLRRWRCAAADCGVAEQVNFALSRKCLDVDGAGPKLVAALIDAGMVTDHADMFALDPAAVAQLPGMGATSAEKLEFEMAKAKDMPLSRQLVALGMRYCGTRLSTRIAAAFGTLDGVLAASVDDMCEIEGIGVERGASIVAELVELRPVIDKLVAAGVRTDEPTVQVAASAPLAGKKVCVTGTLPSMSRTDAQEAVVRLGGTVSSSVSKATDVLVAGEKAGSKLAKAEQFGIEVLDGATFEALVAAHS
jgi:DNA ligase (NAD+)